MMGPNILFIGVITKIIPFIPSYLEPWFMPMKKKVKHLARETDLPLRRNSSRIDININCFSPNKMKTEKKMSLMFLNLISHSVNWRNTG